jgi:hypothetical protein
MTQGESVDEWQSVPTGDCLAMSSLVFLPGWQSWLAGLLFLFFSLAQKLGTPCPKRRTTPSGKYIANGTFVWSNARATRSSHNLPHVIAGM